MAGVNAVSTSTGEHGDSTAYRVLERGCWLLLAFEVLLGVAHLLWPVYEWGQSRRSYFHFDNSLTLASWLASMQLVGAAILCFAAGARDSIGGRKSPAAWVWFIGGLFALLLSFAELTRFPDRLDLLGYPKPDAYQQFIFYPLWLTAFALFGLFLVDRVGRASRAAGYAYAWLVAWGTYLLLMVLLTSLGVGRSGLVGPLLRGWSYLSGCTFLLLALGAPAFGPARTDRATRQARPLAEISFTGASRRVVFVAVGGMTFAILFLQIILFQMLTIFGDYLTANSVISIALLGIAIGGLVGALTARTAALQAMIGGSLSLPGAILLAFGTTVRLSESPLLASILLTLPFACCSVVITVALARIQSHVVYFVDLLGAALGALFVGAALSLFREEGSLLLLCGFGFVLSGFLLYLHPNRRMRTVFLPIVVGAALVFTYLAGANLRGEWLNVVRERVTQDYPRAEVLFSSSSFVGRYDVVRRDPSHRSVATFNNGRIIDNMRRRPPEHYQIDPRVPHTLMEDPDILILGLSGDGISKTARFLGDEVFGIEINPAVVHLQRDELVPFNANSYEGIDVSVMDGRTYVEQSDRKYDIITLMNAHSARGRTAGRAPSPEYLHTREAMDAYLDHLTDRGVVIIEEPVSRPRREPPVWKLVRTMREALAARGVSDPEKHFFIFQWRTKRNNYIQIVMKKLPFTDDEAVRLRQWLTDVDGLLAIERKLGRRMGPIRCKTTILHAPDEPMGTNYSRLLRGEVSDDFITARNLVVTTDDRPFHFDVDPARPELRTSYLRTLLMTLLLLPLLLFFLVRNRGELSAGLPYVFVVTLTGVGYFLVEVVLIQRYQIFLGTPFLTVATMLGTLLFFSGLGSLWSGRVAAPAVYGAIAAVLVLLTVQELAIPTLFSWGASLPVAVRVILAILVVAPLAFCMGVPFPYVLRTGKVRFTETTAALLFAINAAASALTVPLTLNLSTSAGFQSTFIVGMVIYVVVGAVLLAMHKPALRGFANAAALVAIGGLLVCPWLLSERTGRAAAADGVGRNRVYAINYGQSRRAESRVLHRGSSSRRVRFDWYFWLIEGNGRRVLVDTGVDDREVAARRGIRSYVAPATRLRELGIEPSDIDDVILTHGHWDHIGGLAAYDKATIWMQEEELRYMQSVVNPENLQRKGMRWKDVRLLESLQQNGRLELVRGEERVAPGIDVVLGAGHTPGSQWVKVETLDGSVVLAGDSTYLYRSNQWHRPIGSAVDRKANLATIQAMQRAAASPFFLIPGHDPRVGSNFPQVAEGIVEIAAVAD